MGRSGTDIFIPDGDSLHLQTDDGSPRRILVGAVFTYAEIVRSSRADYDLTQLRIILGLYSCAISEPSTAAGGQVLLRL